MPPHGSTNPAPKTESAREARKSFHCELCGKGYARMNEFEAHEGSYDHLHTKRLKEMKQMSRDPSARSKALRAERRADEKSGLGLITIKPLNSGGGNASTTNALEGGTSGSGTSTTTAGAGKTTTKGKGFKKGGFRNAFGGGDAVTVGTTTTLSSEIETRDEKAGGGGAAVVGVKLEIDMGPGTGTGAGAGSRTEHDDINDTDSEESENEESVYAAEGGRYDPSKPTGCGEGCRGR